MLLDSLTESTKAQHGTCIDMLQHDWLLQLMAGNPSIMSITTSFRVTTFSDVGGGKEGALPYLLHPFAVTPSTTNSTSTSPTPISHPHHFGIFKKLCETKPGLVKHEFLLFVHASVLISFLLIQQVAIYLAYVPQSLADLLAHIGVDDLADLLVVLVKSIMTSATELAVIFLLHALSPIYLTMIFDSTGPPVAHGTMVNGGADYPPSSQV
jgi:hypothetical protein